MRKQSDLYRSSVSTLSVFDYQMTLWVVELTPKRTGFIMLASRLKRVKVAKISPLEGWGNPDFRPKLIFYKRLFGYTLAQ
ncbi:MAG: hypothetical protein KDC53_00435 [Saprospiraceae bacterium]|nr:hypothetical protein [Saprospiraceae bacterium]